MSNESIKRVSEVVGHALTEIRARTTRASQRNTEPFKWEPDFQTFGEASLDAAKKQAIQFCRDIRDYAQPYWLTLIGRSGVGKSHLAKQIRAYYEVNPQFDTINGRAGVVTQRLWACSYNWRSISKRLLNGEWDLVEAIADMHFAVIDDVGTEHDPTGVLRSAIDDICNRRLGKWTVITSNLTKEEIGTRMDVRILSRMKRQGNRIVEIVAKDYVNRV